MFQDFSTRERRGSSSGGPARSPATIPEILARSVALFPNRVAMQSCGSLPGRSYTYAQIGRFASEAARQLRARGAGKGAPVALLCENRPEWAIAYFAVHLSGTACVPIDAKLTPMECRSILDRSGARLVLASRALLSTAAQASDSLPGVCVVAIGDLLAAARADSGAAPLSSPGADEVAPDDVAVIAFTSGTTGTSKGVVLTHRNIASNAVSGAGWMDGTGDDRLLSVLPLSHLFEQTGGLLVPFLWGASIAYPGTLSPRRLADAMRQFETTVMLIVPAMARLFQKLFASVDNTRAVPGARRDERLRSHVRSLLGERFRYFISGGAALDAGLARFFLDLDLPVLQGYGLSETAPLVSCNTLDEHAVGSVGRPFPGVEVRIRPVPGRGRNKGEILVRGPNVMTGYFEDPQATEAVFEDGWFCTGDLGRLDDEGYLYVLGRLKDVIVGESGLNIYPEEVEAEVLRSPYIREACVLGVRPVEDPRRGEEVAVLVVPDADRLGDTHPGDEFLRDQVGGMCAALADYKRPRRFAVWLGEFPRTATMKLKKHEIRKRLGEVKLTRM